jgi:serine/threonine-protein kinase HipA
MIRKAKVYIGTSEAGTLTELKFREKYIFVYLENYSGRPVSLTMPISQKIYEFLSFPPFFDGLLPEGHQLEGLLKFGKIDRNDFFSQLMAVGEDLIGNVSVKEIES